MKFSIWQILIFTGFVAVGFAIANIFDSAYGPIVTYLMLASAFCLSRFQVKTNCPKFLFFRWHIFPIAIAFYSSFYGFAYGAIGLWRPPASYILAFLWILVLPVLQVAKFHYATKPNIELRMTQLAGSWAIVILNSLSLSIGRYVGP